MKNKIRPLDFNRLTDGKAFRFWMAKSGMSHEHAWDVLNALRGPGAPAPSESSSVVTIYAAELWGDYVLYVSTQVIADKDQVRLRQRQLKCVKKDFKK